MRLAIIVLLALAGSAAARKPGTVTVAARPSLSLPSNRPPLWPFRTYADAKGWSCSMNPNGALVLEVQHKNIPGVTSEQLMWLYSSGLMGSSAHPETGKVYPNYLLFHPRDHAQAAMSEGPLTAKLTKYWMLDYPLTGCKETGKALEPYSCDKTGSNPGYTASAGVAALAAAERVNSTSVLLKLPKSSLDFGVKGCNEKGRCAYVVKSSHSYSDTNSGLQLTTRQQIGLDAAFARAAINPRVITGWAAGSEPMKKCSRAALHFIEEMGALQHWLPQAYKAANAGGAA